MIDYYDRQGRPLTDEAERRRLRDDDNYRRVAQTELDDPLVWISTVWLGLDHGFADGPPIIFETMVFRRWPKEMAELGRLTGGPTGPPLLELDAKRYATEAEALAGHEAMVAKWRGRVLPPPHEYEIDNQDD